MPYVVLLRDLRDHRPRLHFYHGYVDERNAVNQPRNNLKCKQQ
jgi:hypothetical protein